MWLNYNSDARTMRQSCHSSHSSSDVGPGPQWWSNSEVAPYYIEDQIVCTLTELLIDCYLA